MSKYEKLFNTFDQAIQLFIQEVDRTKLTNMATDKWTVKDVLCHIVFWHNYYAKQYEDIAKGAKPFVFTSMGGSTRNQEGVDSLKNMSKKDLIKILNNSQASLYNSIVVKKIPEMDYTNRKHYKTEEFLDVVTGHIIRHSLQVKKAKI